MTWAGELWSRGELTHGLHSLKFQDLQWTRTSWRQRVPETSNSEDPGTLTATASFLLSTSTSSHYLSFYPRTTIQWNCLPQSFFENTNLDWIYSASKLSSPCPPLGQDWYMWRFGDCLTLLWQNKLLTD